MYYLTNKTVPVITLGIKHPQSNEMKIQSGTYENPRDPDTEFKTLTKNAIEKM